MDLIATIKPVELFNENIKSIIRREVPKLHTHYNNMFAMVVTQKHPDKEYVGLIRLFHICGYRTVTMPPTHSSGFEFASHVIGVQIVSTIVLDVENYAKLMAYANGEFNHLKQMMLNEEIARYNNLLNSMFGGSDGNIESE